MRLFCATTGRSERGTLSGSKAPVLNSPVLDGSNIPEEEPSPPEDDPEGGAVLTGGAELSKVESLVFMAVVAVSVVSVE